MKKKLYIIYNFFPIETFSLLIICPAIFLNRFAGPQVHRCCWLRRALKEQGNSLFTYRAFEHWFKHITQGAKKREDLSIYTFRSSIYSNFQPLSVARTAKSMSSTVVWSFHPPDSFSAEILQTPAVPAVVSDSQKKLH